MRSVLLVLLTASPAFAYKPGPPVRRDVFSQNRQFVVDVNPHTGVNIVYDAGDRTKPLWSLSRSLDYKQVFLSNDGTVVARVGWEFIQVNDIPGTPGVEFWNQEGKFRAYALSDLCPNPQKTRDVGVGPEGDFWRTWYTKVSDQGDSFTIQTTCGNDCQFRYSDGELLGDDLAKQRFVKQQSDTNSMWLAVLALGLVLVLVLAGLWLWRRSIVKRSYPK